MFLVAYVRTAWPSSTRRSAPVLVPIHGSREHVAAHAIFDTAQGVSAVLPLIDAQILEIRRDGGRAAGGAAPRPWVWDGRRVRLA